MGISKAICHQPPDSFLDELHNRDLIIISTNQHWNPDNLAAIIVLSKYLQKRQKTATILSFGPISANLRQVFPAAVFDQLSIFCADIDFNAIKMDGLGKSLKKIMNTDKEINGHAQNKPEHINLPNHDLIITVGSVPESNKEFFADDATLHIFIAYNASYEVAQNFLSTESSTLSEMVYSILNEDDIDPLTAQILYSGIVYATGSFRYQKTASHTHKIAAHLMSIGNIHPNQVFRRIFEQKPIAELMLFRLIAQTAKIDFNNQVVYFHCTEQMMSETGTNLSAVIDLEEYPFLSNKVRISCLFLPEKNHRLSKLILLCKDPFNALDILEPYFPLGDERRAEAILPFNLDQAQQQMHHLLQRILVRPKPSNSS